MPQCSAERDAGPGCGITYCIREAGHKGEHEDYQGHRWLDESKG